MAYQQPTREPAPVEPDQGNLTGYAAIKYSAIVIVVLAILFFLAWALTHFVGH